MECSDMNAKMIGPLGEAKTTNSKMSLIPRFTIRAEFILTSRRHLLLPFYWYVSRLFGNRLNMLPKQIYHATDEVRCWDSAKGDGCCHLCCVGRFTICDLRCEGDHDWCGGIEV